jgi:hypothetical protein
MPPRAEYKAQLLLGTQGHVITMLFFKRQPQLKSAHAAFSYFFRAKQNTNCDSVSLRLFTYLRKIIQLHMTTWNVLWLLTGTNMGEKVMNNFKAKSRHILQLWSLNSGVCIETSHGMDGPGFDFRQDTQIFISYPIRPDRLWGPPSLLFNW